VTIAGKGTMIVFARPKKITLPVRDIYLKDGKLFFVAVIDEVAEATTILAGDFKVDVLDPDGNLVTRNRVPFPEQGTADKGRFWVILPMRITGS
jgi:hypothetical protein